MNIMQGDSVFVLRYNNNFMKDSMKIHKAICEIEGFCWYGKNGKRPDVDKLNRIIENGNAKVLFYNRQRTFIGNLIAISLTTPKTGVSDYYAKAVWKPSIWLKVTRLDEIGLDILSKLKVNSTGKTMKETINSSMTSFYFTTANANLFLLEEDKSHA